MHRHILSLSENMNRAIVFSVFGMVVPGGRTGAVAGEVWPESRMDTCSWRCTYEPLGVTILRRRSHTFRETNLTDVRFEVHLPFSPDGRGGDTASLMP